MTSKKKPTTSPLRSSALGPALCTTVFFAGALALVNPAMTEKCAHLSQLATSHSTALDAHTVTRIERAVSDAVSHQADGNVDACLAELARACSLLRA
ncbi:MAG: hypothetical protein WBO55_18320 [Rhizobiaceae bacterium]